MPQNTDEEFEDDKTLKDYNIYKDTTIRLEINRSREKEIWLAVGGKMKQKIYEDDKDNIDFYHIKRVTRLFVNICNGTMWQAITGKKLPPSPLTPQTNRLFITTHSFDSVYFGIIFDIDVYKRKQSKTATTSINKWDSEAFTVIGTLVVDIYQQTQTEKTLLDNFFQWLFDCGI